MWWEYRNQAGVSHAQTPEIYSFLLHWTTTVIFICVYISAVMSISRKKNQLDLTRCM